MNLPSMSFTIEIANVAGQYVVMVRTEGAAGSMLSKPVRTYCPGKADLPGFFASLADEVKPL